VIRKDGEVLAKVRILDLTQLVVCGPVQVSHAVIHALCDAGIPLVHLSGGHWFHGVTTGISLRNAFDRAAQFRAVDDESTVLAFARALVAGKIRNQRTLLLRNASPRPDAALVNLSRLARRAAGAEDVPSLLGLEGMAARHYFGAFASMLRPDDLNVEWDFKGRNRRPPRDPVNAMLSFVYALLSKEVTVAILAEGLDPWWGLYHRPRHGRPALALDLMEELRPLVADSAVITAINTGMVKRRSFERTRTAATMNASGRKAMIQALEARLDQLVTHPVFDYRCSWRTVIRLQVRLFARWLRGDVPKYTTITTR
jgi:CRISPR-associated protein Cas1